MAALAGALGTKAEFNRPLVSPVDRHGPYALCGPVTDLHLFDVGDVCFGTPNLVRAILAVIQALLLN
jgi:hypothetical protein